MTIIIEGPDGGGKSTLVRYLHHTTKTEIGIRACTSEGGPVDDLAEWVQAWFIGKQQNPGLTLHDRHPLISEPIYGSVIRGCMAEHFDGEWYGRALQALFQHDPLIVICLPPREVAREAALKNAEEQMDGVLTHFDTIYSLYSLTLTMWRQLGFKVWQYDYTTPLADYDRLVIAGYIAQRRLAAEGRA